MTGILRKTLHWGPLIALSIIAYISFCAVLACLHGWPPIESRTMIESSRTIRKGVTNFKEGLHAPTLKTEYTFSLEGFVRLALFLFMLGEILANYFLAMGKGPGYVPASWKPEVPHQEKHLQLCHICDTLKAPRAHHCRACDRCTLKMDHHCPWINNCVGYKNQRNFVLFLVWVTVNGIYTACILLEWLVVLFSDHRVMARYTLDLILCFIGICLTIGVIVAVGFLAFHQFQVILRNMTDIEEWIMSKAVYRAQKLEKQPTAFPYKLSKLENWQQVMGKGFIQLYWPWYTPSELNRQLQKYPGVSPTHPPKQLAPPAESNGLWWPVHEKCHQYTLTEEQVQQKQEKLSHSQLVTVQRPYSGWMWGYSVGGCKLLWAFPSWDDPQLAVNSGDAVLVIRRHKGWLYAENQGPESAQASDGGAKRKKEFPKGWFPESCVDVKED